MKEFLSGIFPGIAALCLALVGGGVGYGRISQRVKIVEKGIFDADGNYKFPTVTMFDKQQVETCKKIEEVKKLVVDGERKRDEARGEYLKQVKDIAHFMGSVETWMKDHEP